MLLSDKEIEAELSYAYLHAVAARAGFTWGIIGVSLNAAARHPRG